MKEKPGKKAGERGCSKQTGDAAGSNGMPKMEEADLALMHLMLAQLDSHRVVLLSEHAPNNEVLKDAAERYWSAFTRGWGRVRHARVYLLQCVDEVEPG